MEKCCYDLIDFSQIPGNPCSRTDLPPSSDIENAGYESSHASSQDLTEDEDDDDGNFVIEFPGTKGTASVTSNEASV